ncbi:hypothetical protein [Enterococcus sp. AZ109]|uniref:hypothetical protein n=1 Tax=Enterococcus sp. AZ109 TaxID=2774634 RepID=UPI003F25C95A
MTKKNRKILLIISLAFLLTLGYFGYQRWHYETANAFYISYKNKEPLVKQQEAFVNNIDPELMKQLKVDVQYKERSSELYSMSVNKNKKKYVFAPKTAKDLIVQIYDAKSSENIYSFWIEIDSNEFLSLRENEKIDYEKCQDEAMEIYQNIFKEVYENWEIK